MKTVFNNSDDDKKLSEKLLIALCFVIKSQKLALWAQEGPSQAAKEGKAREFL